MNRHDLIYLQPGETYQFLDQSLPLDVQHKVKDMILQNIPFTVCRQDTENYFKVAINCMLQGRKYRVALGLTSAPGLSHRPPQLSVVLDLFTDAVRNRLRQFIHQMHIWSCQVYVYGSYANQYLHQECFLHAESDLDLLVEPKELGHLNKILQEIRLLKNDIHIDIDGEFALAHAQNISFNELIAAHQYQQEQIIVKGLREISLQNIAEICGGNLNALSPQHSACST